MIQATLYTDPGCPWAYSEIPALSVLRWRYGPQLDWRLVVIGLSESTERYLANGYTPIRRSLGQMSFRRYGMPFQLAPKERMSATARACRAIVAARQARPGSEWAVLRALQLANFTTSMLLDDEAQIEAALAVVPELDPAEIVARLDSSEVGQAYDRDRAEARSAAGSAAELQGKTATSDGPVRFTAPSVVFASNGTRLVAGGFQPVEAYDVLVVNLDPTLDRRAEPETPEPLLEYFREGLTTQEVAALMAGNNESPDPERAERALLELVGAGAAVRRQAGDGAVWARA
jgi:predicted DsbA family dithiol-disulfide isomerase